MSANETEGSLDCFASTFILGLSQGSDQELFKIFEFVDLAQKEFRFPDKTRQHQIQSML